MGKRRLPLVPAGPGPDESTDSGGGFGAWAGVAFFAALTVWLLLASFVSRAAPELASRLFVSAKAELAFVVATHAGAFAVSASAAGFLVGKYGGAAPERSAHVGVGAVVLIAVGLASRASVLGALLAGAMLAPALLAGVRLGFRRGRVR